MMTLAHAACGAALGRRIRSPVVAACACVGAHGLLDLPRHEDLDERREGALAVATIGLMASLFGVASRETWCGFACSAPDLEHVLRRGHRGLFPTHRFRSLHGTVPTPYLDAATQVALALGVLYVVSRSRG